MPEERARAHGEGELLGGVARLPSVSCWYVGTARWVCAVRPSAARGGCPGGVCRVAASRDALGVVCRLSGRHPGSGHGFGKEAHETVSWEKARRARRPQLTVAAAAPALMMTQSAYCAGGHERTGFLFGCPQNRCNTSAAIKLSQESWPAARRPDRAHRSAAQPLARIHHLLSKNSTKNSTKKTEMPVYRCGICNVFSSSLEQHARHLNGARHKRNEASALAGTVRAASNGDGKGRNGRGATRPPSLHASRRWTEPHRLLVSRRCATGCFAGTRSARRRRFPGASAATRGATRTCSGTRWRRRRSKSSTGAWARATRWPNTTFCASIDSNGSS